MEITEIKGCGAAFGVYKGMSWGFYSGGADLLESEIENI